MLLLPAILTNTEAREALKGLLQTLAAEAAGAAGAADATPVVVDASPLKQFDTSALAVLLACQRQAQAHGRRLVLHQAPVKLQALAKLYGVEVFLPADAAGQLHALG